MSFLVGGGIVGLATAREVLARYPKMTVAVIEKEREVAPHQTGHNSGVVNNATVISNSLCAFS